MCTMPTKFVPSLENKQLGFPLWTVNRFKALIDKSAVKDFAIFMLTTLIRIHSSDVVRPQTSRQRPRTDNFSEIKTESGRFQDLRFETTTTTETKKFTKT